MEKIFLEAIKQKNKVNIKILKEEKNEIIEIKCIPFSIAPPKIGDSKSNVFHFYNLDDIQYETYFTVKPEDIVSIEITDESFDPLKINKNN